MRIAKKLLCTVLAIGLVASTIVMPLSVKAADGDVIHKLTFDDGTDQGLLGSEGLYTALDGDAKFNNTYLGLKPADKVIFLSAENRGTSTTATSTAGALSFGNSHSANFEGKKHVTIQFDMIVGNAHATFDMIPSGDDRFGIRVAHGDGDNTMITALNVQNSNWGYTALEETVRIREEWHQYALEYDMENGIYKIYLDGTEVYQTTGLTVGNDAPADFQIYCKTFNSNGEHMYYGNAINNFYVYEGGYDANAVADPFYPVASYDFTTDGVDGFAGKPALDKVLMGDYRPKPGGSTNQSYETEERIVTYEASVYVPAGGRVVFHAYNESRTGANNNNRATFDINAGVVRADYQSGWAKNSLDASSYCPLTWNKLAIEMNKTANTVKFYLNGNLINTVTGAMDTSSNYFPYDFGTSDSSSGVAVDNMKMYEGAYKADDAITVTGVTDGVISVTGSAKLADVIAKAAGNDRVVVYADDALTTEASSINNAKNLFIQNDELYTVYPIVTPYGDDYVYYTFTNDTDATTFGGVSQANGLAGKTASDKVAVTTAKNHTRDKGNTYDTTTGYVTYETQVYIPDTSKQNYRMMAFDHGNWNNARSTLQILNGVVQYNVANADHWNTMTSSDVKIESKTWNKLAMTWDFANQKVLFYVNGVKIGELIEPLMSNNKASGDFGFGSSSTGVYIDNVRAYNMPYVVDAPIADLASADDGVINVTDGVINVTEGTTCEQVKAMVEDGTAEVYTGATLETVASTLADDCVLLIKKGELYKTYTIDVSGLYDDAVLAVDFDTRSIVDGANLAFAAKETSNWFYWDDGDPVLEYRAGLGGKAATDYAAVVAYDEDDKTVRMQTGVGNANAKATDKVYTLEADVYKIAGSNINGIAFKMTRADGEEGALQVNLKAPNVANRWYNLAITVDTVNKTVKGYVNGVDATDSMTYYFSRITVEDYTIGSLTADNIDFTVVSDQVDANFGAGSTTAVDNLRVYAGAYRGGTAPAMAESVKMAANSTVADVIKATDADFVVDANGVKVENSATVATGYQAVKVDGEMFAYTTVEVKSSAPETVVFNSIPLAVEHYKGANGVDYVMMPVVTEGVVAIEEYKTFVFKAGDDTRAISLSDLPGFTTVDGAVNIGILVMNIPAAEQNNWKAMITKTDIADMAKPE